MLKDNPKSQAALEFLITYGWVLVVIMITIAALYSFDFLSFSKYLPKECAFPSQFNCLDFQMDSAAPGTVKFRLLNGIGEELNIISASITNDAATPLTCTTLNIVPPTASPPVNWLDSEEKDFEFTGCSGSNFLSKERIEAKITITYCAVNTPGCPEHKINGKIKGAMR